MNIKVYRVEILCLKATVATLRATIEAKDAEIARLNRLATALRNIVNSALARGIDSGSVDATHVLEGLSLLKELDGDQ